MPAAGCCFLLRDAVQVLFQVKVAHRRSRDLEWTVNNEWLSWGRSSAGGHQEVGVWSPLVWPGTEQHMRGLLVSVTLLSRLRPSWPWKRDVSDNETASNGGRRQQVKRERQARSGAVRNLD